MITPEYCSVMARYGRWQNQSLVSAADALPEAARNADRGAFFGSIAGTLNHLLWGDLIWMSRFDGGAAPSGGIDTSAALIPDWQMFQARRSEVDARIVKWADLLDQAELAGDLVWFSGALNAKVTKKKALCVAHMFNHATHHRGQIHAMLTAAGARPDDTDLFIMPEDQTWQ